MGDTTGVVLRVSASKEPGYVKRVAGAISWQLRDKGFCKLRAVKVDAVNTATKAVAIINQRVSQAGLKFAIDLVFSPADSDGNQTSTAIEMTVQDTANARPGEFVEYKVSGQKNSGDVVAKLAGAIAAPVRQGKGVALRCIGPAAVYRAVTACCVSKGYIYTNGLDAVVVPTWDSLPSDREEKKTVSLLQIEFWGEKNQT